MRCALFPLIDEAGWGRLSQEERDREIAAFRAFLVRIAAQGPALRHYDMEQLGAVSPEDDEELDAALA